ncbi:MAG: hypothetical protein GOMPHAMPRED_002745 [Gomphillus americanus]|uniref:Uncharacterized protein n=1 Tax=Gomphillus americanus TaxID=1940652 RepID=A0A8H3FLE9_9LECA|nr:MAG: hypothetical protein GOMPHAMPRED_002745 [Gomphillus americanus]
MVALLEKMTLIEVPPLHLQMPMSTPNLLKASTSLELEYDISNLGLRTSVSRLCSKEKGRIAVLEVPWESGYSLKPAVEENLTSWADSAREVKDFEPQQQTKSQPSKTNLLDLPDEIQQDILGYLVGSLSPLSSKSSSTAGVRNWHYALRHSRAKEQTSLALVTRKWTTFIQQRLYRHIRIQGTRGSLNECYVWFLTRPHLQAHVRHIDFWIPVWEKRPLVSIPIPPRHEDLHQADMVPISSNYQMSSDNSTVEEIFDLAKAVFNKACVLTLQGGTCKKPPKVPFNRRGNHGLPEMPNVRTLVLKGAWTLIRDTSDFEQLSEALPNLTDWQCMFALPKYKAYVAMNELIPKISSRLTHLQICMDGFYSKKWLNPLKVENLRERHHLCESLGKLMTQLEALTFSGRACYSLFSAAIEACSRNGSTKPRLRTLDLALRSCCRDHQGQFGESSGVLNREFIAAFERLVAAATASLKSLTNLTNVRIRFIDLDSPIIWFNPYFQLKDSVAYGLRSEAIISNLNSLTRPIKLAEEPEVFECEYHKFPHGRRAMGRRPNRIDVDEYEGARLAHW